MGVPQLTFFDVAAALIPVLLLGGVATQLLALGGGREASLNSWLSFPVVLLFGALPGFAEVTALSAALSDAPSAFQVWVVVLAVAFGTWSLALSLVWPWLRPPSWLRYRKAMLVGYGLVFLALLAASAALLRSSVGVEISTSELARPAEEPEALTTEALLNVLDAEESLLDAERAAGNISRERAVKLRVELARRRYDYLLKDNLAKANFEALVDRLERDRLKALQPAK